MIAPSHHSAPLSNKAGFSLVELMVVLAVMAIMSAIAIPSVLAWMPDIYLKDQAAELKQSMMKARSLAINNGTEHRVLLDMGAGTFSIERGDLMVGSSNWTPLFGPYETSSDITFLSASTQMESAGTNQPFVRFGGNGGVVTNVDTLVLRMTNSKSHILALNLSRRTGHVAIVKEYMP